MTVKCPKCRTENPETQRFCGDCGTSLTVHVTPQISVTRTIETGVQELARGTTFAGRYEIVEELGAGGMGRVYRAFDKKLQEDVALKLIRPDIGADKRTVERFHNEIKIARKIRHKNVCGMYDFHEEGKTLYLTMEFVRGEDLRSLIHRMKLLPTGTAVSISRQIAEGLSEAHKLGIVHRDLKPGNIMIDKDGQAKIMDFGIARSLLGKGLTGEGAIVGTPEYMSPEQVEGKETDQRSDLYALGVILYEMLIGRPPFEGETPFSVAAKHKTEPPPIPKKIIPQIPEELNKLILRCLEKDKTNRYQTAEELAVDLSAIEQSLPSTDRALTQARTKIRTSREITVKLTPKRLALPIAGIGLIVLALVLWRVVFPKKEPPPSPKIANSIAIVSLKNLTGDPDPTLNELCRRAIPELLITSLEEGGHLRIASWQRMTDVLKQAGKKDVASITDEDGFEICRRAGIKYLVSGSLNKAGDTIVTDLKFLDAESEEKETRKSFQSKGRGAQSIFDEQIDDLSRQIGQWLGLTAQEAQSSVPRIADLTTSSPEAYQAYLEGVDAFHDYQHDDARKALERTIRIDPNFPSAHLYLAMTFQRFSEFAAAKKSIIEAERLADRATEKEKIDIKAVKAEIFGDDEALKALIPEMEKLVARFPDDKELHFGLGILLAELAGAYDRGFAEMRRVLELDPEFAPAYMKMWLYCSTLGKLQDAIEYAKKYRAIDPANPFATDALAFSYIEAGHFADAEAVNKKALDRHADFDKSYLCLAYLTAMREDYSASASWLEKFFERSWGRPAVESEAHLLNGILCLWRGRYEQGLMEFDRSAWLAERGDNKLLLRLAASFRAAVQEEKGDRDTARKDLLKLIDASNDGLGGSPAWMKSSLVYCLGMLDMNSGQWEVARKQADELNAILSNPGELMAWGANETEVVKKNISRLRTLLECEIAIRLKKTTAEDIRRKLEGNPKPNASYGDRTIHPVYIEYFHFLPPFAEDTLARAYVSEGKLKKAMVAYENMIKSPPEKRNLGWIHPLAHYRLAQVYENLGRKKDAVTEYRKFLDLWQDADSGRPEVGEARAALARLK